MKKKLQLKGTIAMLADSVTVRVFRKYARLGLDRDGIGYFNMYARLRGCCSTEREALSLAAVGETMRGLAADGKSETAEAVRAVYFACRGRTPRKNDISYRVRRFAREKHCDERTVWRRLEAAKELYGGIYTELNREGHYICS